MYFGMSESVKVQRQEFESVRYLRKSAASQTRHKMCLIDTGRFATHKVMSRPIHLITATDLVNFGTKLLAELGKSEVAKLLDSEPSSRDDILQISRQIDYVRVCKNLAE